MYIMSVVWNRNRNRNRNLKLILRRAGGLINTESSTNPSLRVTPDGRLSRRAITVCTIAQPWEVCKPQNLLLGENWVYPRPADGYDLRGTHLKVNQQGRYRPGNSGVTDLIFLSGEVYFSIVQ